MSEKTRLIIAGDLFPMPCNYSLFEKGDVQALFGEKLCELFALADYRICNLEGCFTDNNTPIEKAGPNIKAPTSCIKAVKALRAILNANDLLEGKGGLKLRNVNKNILEILNITGFTEYLDII